MEVIESCRNQAVPLTFQTGAQNRLVQADSSSPQSLVLLSLVIIDATVFPLGTCSDGQSKVLSKSMGRFFLGIVLGNDAYLRKCATISYLPKHSGVYVVKMFPVTQFPFLNLFTVALRYRKFRILYIFACPLPFSSVG